MRSTRRSAAVVWTRTVDVARAARQFTDAAVSATRAASSGPASGGALTDTATICAACAAGTLVAFEGGSRYAKPRSDDPGSSAKIWFVERIVQLSGPVSFASVTFTVSRTLPTFVTWKGKTTAWKWPSVPGS